MIHSQARKNSFHARRWGLAAAVLAWIASFAPQVWAARAVVELPKGTATLRIFTVAPHPYVDARAVAVLVSGQLEIDPARGQAALRVGAHTLALNLATPLLQIGERSLPLSAPPILRGRRFLVPLDVLPAALGQRFGQDAVRWDPEHRVARIHSGEPTVTRLRLGTYPTYTRVVLETAGSLEWSAQEDSRGNPVVVVPGGVLAPGIQSITLRTGVVREIHPAQRAGGVEVTLVREHRNTTLRAFALKDPDRIVMDVLALPPEEDGEKAVRKRLAALVPTLPAPARVQPATRADLPTPDERSALRTPSDRAARLTAPRPSSAKSGDEAAGQGPESESPPAPVQAGLPLREPPILIPLEGFGPTSLESNGPSPPPPDPKEGASQEAPAARPSKDVRRASLPAPKTDPGLRTPAAGLLTVVLDPGHGGHDTGAVGPKGLMEKDVVLDLALRLRRLLHERLGVRVVLTRSEDVFVPLPERTTIANQAKADFFISLHVNASTKRGAVGFETFYFTREPSDSDARGSAQRENLALDRNGGTANGQESLLRTTLVDMAVTRDMRESSQLAEFALSSLDRILKVENRGVKSGPFYVLATAAMPAVLVESAFITNPKEERKLQQDRYRQRIVQALFEAIAKYKVRYERRVGLRGGASGPAGS